MNSFVIYFLFVFFSFGFVESKELCDNNDLACVTKGIRNVYKALLTGGTGYETIEPLLLDNVSGRIEGFKYSLHNVTISPMKNCEPTSTFMNETSYVYVLHCTHLTLNAKAFAKGRLEFIDVDGEDFITLTVDDYTITAKGEYKLVDATEDRPKHYVVSNTGFTVDTEVQGPITFKASNAFGLPKQQAENVKTYFEENWKQLEKTFRYPIVTEFMSDLILNKIAAYLKVNPADKITPKEV